MCARKTSIFGVREKNSPTGSPFIIVPYTVKPVYNGHSQKDQKMVFKTNYRLMQVKNIAECSKGRILQYFRPSLSYHLSLRPLSCLFLRGRFTHVLLYLLTMSPE